MIFSRSDVVRDNDSDMDSDSSQNLINDHCPRMKKEIHTLEQLMK